MDAQTTDEVAEIDTAVAEAEHLLWQHMDALDALRRRRWALQDMQLVAAATTVR